MRLIDADALIEKWYEVNDIGPEDRGARFIGYTEIPRFINNAPTVETTGDYIKRADAMGAVQDHFNADGFKGYDDGQKMMDRIKALPSADAEKGYTEWLEKIIVDNEGANEWLCEDTPDMEWCEKNCHYSSIQAECLRHLYEVSKGGDDE